MTETVTETCRENVRIKANLNDMNGCFFTLHRCYWIIDHWSIYWSESIYIPNTLLDNILTLCFEKIEKKKKNYKCIWIKRTEHTTCPLWNGTEWIHSGLPWNLQLLIGRSVSAALSHPACLLGAGASVEGADSRVSSCEEQLRCPSPNTSCSPLCLRWIIILWLRFTAATVCFCFTALIWIWRITVLHEAGYRNILTSGELLFNVRRDRCVQQNVISLCM